MKIATYLVLAALLAWRVQPVAAAEPDSGPPAGLTVREGQLRHKGEPFRGVGANCFNLFSRTLADPADDSYRNTLKTLSDAGVPFVRFMAGGFWPVDWDLYLKDKDAWFTRLDKVVRSAEENGIGLIPSLFWNMATVPDIVGEPIDQLGNPDSRTLAFIRNYTREVVDRYRSSPAVWGWEFGNEYNLDVDLPNASEHRPPVWPALKTAASRSERDELSSSAMLTAYSVFAKTVRDLDPDRILITGNAIPRPGAYHNSHQKSWGPDSPEQFREILLRDNPDPFDVICVHVYPVTDQRYPAGATNLADLVKTLRSISVQAGKPLFIGEFGASRSLGEAPERSAFRELLAAIETSDIPLSAFWVFDFSGQDADWNVTPDNSRAYMLKLVADVNQRMRQASDKEPQTP